MRLQFTMTILIIVTTLRSFACDCGCVDDCSFHRIVKNAPLVALVKVVSYDGYLTDEIMGHDGKMPHSMTVEIIKIYKGSETRQQIKIWGDNGILCRPYIANFKIGEYFLIAPDLIETPRSPDEKLTDYEFFTCSTDYLKVDFKTKVAHGQYSKQQDKISLDAFEKTLK